MNNKEYAKDPEFKKTKEWKQNHEKLYDHLQEMKKPRKSKTKQQQELMKAVGVPCTVQEPFEMKVVTEARLEAKYGKGKLKAVWSDIK